MATYTKFMLGGSTNGRGIILHASTSATATTIHTALAGTTSRDEVWLWGYNGHTADLSVSIEWGTKGNGWKVTIPYQSGLVPVIPGLPLDNGLLVTGYASSAGVCEISGFVNRITD